MGTSRAPDIAEKMLSPSELHLENTNSLLFSTLTTSQARRQLEQHCQALESDEGNSTPADLTLLRRAAFEFVWQKLEEKHDAWRASRAQPTHLQALLCALL